MGVHHRHAQPRDPDHLQVVRLVSHRDGLRKRHPHRRCEHLEGRPLRNAFRQDLQVVGLGEYPVEVRRAMPDRTLHPGEIRGVADDQDLEGLFRDEPEEVSHFFHLDAVLSRVAEGKGVMVCDVDAVVYEQMRLNLREFPEERQHRPGMIRVEGLAVQEAVHLEVVHHGPVVQDDGRVHAERFGKGPDRGPHPARRKAHPHAAGLRSPYDISHPIRDLLVGRQQGSIQVRHEDSVPHLGGPVSQFRRELGLPCVLRLAPALGPCPS